MLHRYASHSSRPYKADIPTLLLALLILPLLLCVSAKGQGPQVIISPAPVNNPAWITVGYYDGSLNLQYVCKARTNQRESSIVTASATIASEAVFTVTAGHGVYWVSSTVLAKPRVRIAGGTGDWAKTTGYWILEPQSTTTFKLRDLTTGNYFSSSGFAAGGVVTVYMTTPRLDQGVWAIVQYLYDGSGNWLGTLNGNGGSETLKCSDRAANYTYWQ